MKYYLAEYPHISNTGILHSKSLRCYEVVELPATKSYRINIKSTGKLFILQKNGNIISKSTKATLENKWVSTKDPKKWKYSCCLFSTPEEALLTKLAIIKKEYDKILKVKTTLNNNVEILKNYVPLYTKLLNNHPEVLL